MSAGSRRSRASLDRMANLKESDRLSTLPLERGSGYEIAALEARNRSNEKLVAQLSLQVEHLQSKTRILEQQLDESRTIEAVARREAATADLQTSTLAENLKGVEGMAKKLQIDKETVVAVADRELTEAKIELSKGRNELERLDLEVAQLRAENARLKQDNDRVSRDLNSQVADFDRLESLVDKLQQDKRKLGVRVSKLLETEKALVVELDALKRKKGGQQAAAKRNRSPNRFDQFIRNLEQERDYWKQEVETLQEVLKYRRIGGPSHSPVRSSTVSRSVSSSPARIGQLEAALKSAEEERDFYKRECELQKSVRRASPTRLTPSKSGDSELRRVMMERDELQTILDKFERHMAEIQTNVKVLTGERDRLSHLYDQTKGELQMARHELLRKTPTKSPSLAAQHVLKRVEEERDDALTDLRRSIVERDTLRERLKIATETQIVDRARLEQQTEDLASRLAHMHTEKDELERQIMLMRSHLTKQEEELRQQAARYQEVQGEASQQQKTANQMRLLSNENEKLLQDCQQRLMLRDSELQVLSEKCRSLEVRLADTEAVCTDLRTEVSRLQSAVSVLNREKDNMQQVINEKTDLCVRLDKECKSYEERSNQQQRTTRDLTRKLDQAEEGIVIRDKDLQNQRKQLEKISAELSEQTMSRESTVREYRRLAEDMKRMTEENQHLNRDLQDLMDERQQLADQVQDYVAEVKRVEDILGQKEEERSRLLDQYRSLTAEAQRYEAHTSQLESEGNSLRAELRSKELQLRRLQEQTDVLDREYQQHQLAHQALEDQVSTQNRALGNLEERMRESEREKIALQQELANGRENSVRLENTKESLQRRLVAKELECERATAAVGDLEREIGVLKDRHSSDRVRLTSLEQLLAEQRDKEFQSQLSIQESASEVQLMRDRITLNDSKIESQNRELSQLRSRISELENDIERSRRQLTNERYERERTAQELRRMSESRSGQVTPVRSGQTTPSIHSSPAKVYSPTSHTPSSGRSSAQDPILKSAASVDIRSDRGSKSEGERSN